MQSVFALTAAAVLDLEIFQRADACVVAGAPGLDNTVRWVHSAEISDIARFLVGGELLLTAGLGIGASAAAQRQYIRSLADAGVAMLCIELSGRAFSALPEAVVEAAETAGLPLVTFAREVSFVEVAAQVHNCIVDLRVRELTADAEANATFTGLLLEGQDYVGIVSKLARLIDRSCALEDRAHQLCAYARRSDDADAAIRDWHGHSRGGHAATTGCTRHPVVLKGEMWGWLHVLHASQPLSSSEVRTVERATASIAITLLSEQVRGARRSHRHAILINRLMLGDINGEAFVERALRLGRDIRGKAFIVVVASRGADDGAAFGEAELRSWLAAADAVAVVADIGTAALAVVGLPSKRLTKTIITGLAGLPARIGVSRIVPAPQLDAAVRQAQSAHAAAAIGEGVMRMMQFDDLGVLRLLIALSEGPELAKYVEDELGALLEHDAQTGNQLFPTLRAFLEVDGHKSAAAQRLFVQRRTLYYRLERLNQLLGRSLDDAETRLRLLLAVRALDLLNQRGVPDLSRGRS
jgi:purine catabolism regulator